MAVTRHMANQGVTFGGATHNVGRLMDAAKERSAKGGSDVPQGRDWYETERKEIGGAARRVGVPFQHMQAMTASLSPQVAWQQKDRYPNLEIAEKLGHTLKADPVIHITHEHAEKIYNDQANRPSSRYHLRPMNLHDYNGQDYTGKHRLSELPSEVVSTLGSYKTHPELSFLAEARNRENTTKAV